MITTVTKQMTHNNNNTYTNMDTSIIPTKELSDKERESLEIKAPDKDGDKFCKWHLSKRL